MISFLVDVAGRYPAISDFARSMLEAGFRRHRDWVAKELGLTTGPILDVGCGSGLVAGAIPASQYIGVDCNRTYLAAAQRRHRQHRFMHVDCRQLPFADSSISAAFIVGVLHHLPDGDVSLALAELARVLKPEATLLIAEDSDVLQSSNRINHWVHRLDQGDFIRDAKSYRSLIERNFVVETVQPSRSGFMEYTYFRVRNSRSAEPNDEHHGPMVMSLNSVEEVQVP